MEKITEIGEVDKLGRQSLEAVKQEPSPWVEAWGHLGTTEGRASTHCEAVSDVVRAPGREA